jgi:GTP diphosphokinase / guanosine-3',5'-bis(diphosphate) 3'-diphosphatase
MDNLVLKAREFAREAHKAQPRKYTGEPYFVHLEEVANMVANAGLSDAAVAAAWLHDVVEDQDVTVATITAMFGMEVATMVLALTDEPPGPGINRAGRNAMNLARLSIANWETQSIKCADLISNTSTIAKYDPGFAKTYLPEKRAVLDVLTRAHPGLRDNAEASLRAAERQLSRP